MRRTFLRTSGSPQAPATVETPAHYAPTLFCRLALLSEVVIGSVEPTMSFVPKNAANIHKKFLIPCPKMLKSHKLRQICSLFAF